MESDKLPEHIINKHKELLEKDVSEVKIDKNFMDSWNLDLDKFEFVLYIAIFDPKSNSNHFI